MNFTDFSLHTRLERAITTAGYQVPTPIQEAAIPVVMGGADLVGTAQTGTGKTAAFVLPILHRLTTTPSTARKTRALILTPTRELAEQIHATIRQLGRHTNIRSATVYGGVGMVPQERALRNGTEIIVACPGRLLDHAARGNTDFSHVECVVIDEADRMLDMGFLPPITEIINSLPSERQTLLFSATFDPALNSFVDKHLRSPQRIAVDLQAPAATVEHVLYPVVQHQKIRLLTTLLREIDAKSVLIFTRTKHRADMVAEQLDKRGFAVGVLHADKSQRQRQVAMENFRSGASRYLVATDIAARGIDVSTISHVINIDIPETAEDYIHRIGRTGRAERSGMAFTFVTLQDVRIIRDIERVLGQEIETRFVDGFDFDTKLPTGTKTEHSRGKRSSDKPRSAKPAGKSRGEGTPKATKSVAEHSRVRSTTAKKSSAKFVARDHAETFSPARGGSPLAQEDGHARKSNAGKRERINRDRGEAPLTMAKKKHAAPKAGRDGKQYGNRNAKPNFSSRSGRGKVSRGRQAVAGRTRTAATQ
ncbi:MAG TPA: DEAD/DEAH box helicase [Armatimonadota bacterium]|nr:DEAD/DEAH box helicase [Armatimonadota bacterium]